MQVLGNGAARPYVHLWLLQNTVAFKAPEASIWQSPGGVSVSIDHVLARKLYNDRFREGRHDVGYAAPKHEAFIALSRLVDDLFTPTIELKRITCNEEGVARWHEWRGANSDQYVNMPRAVMS